MPEIPAFKPVFKDVVPAAQAPAAQRAPDGKSIPDARIDAVLKRLGARTAEITPHIAAQPTPDEVAKPIGDSAQRVTEARDNLEILADLKTESGRVAGIKSKLTGRMTQAEKVRQTTEAQRKLEEAEKQATDIEERAKPDQQAAQMYDKEYLEKQAGKTAKPGVNRNEELIEANKRGGPRTTSKEMTNALRHQDQAQSEVKKEDEAKRPLREQKAAYRAMGISDDEASMLPTPVYEAIRTKIAKQVHGKEVVEAGIQFHQTTYDIAREYAEQNGVPIDPEKYHKVIDAAQNSIWSGEDKNIDYKDIDSLMQEYTEERFYHANLTGGPYARARTVLEPLLARLKIPVGAERVPYIYAFCAAKLTSDAHIFEPSHFVRDLLAETVPVTYIDAYGATHDTSPLGLGYLVGQEAKRELDINNNYPYPVLPNEIGRNEALDYSDTRARVGAALHKANGMLEAFGNRAAPIGSIAQRDFQYSIRGINAHFRAFELDKNTKFIPYYPGHWLLQDKSPA